MPLFPLPDVNITQLRGYLSALTRGLKPQVNIYRVCIFLWLKCLWSNWFWKHKKCRIHLGLHSLPRIWQTIDTFGWGRQVDTREGQLYSHCILRVLQLVGKSEIIQVWGQSSPIKNPLCPFHHRKKWPGILSYSDGLRKCVSPPGDKNLQRSIWAKARENSILPKVHFWH